MKDQKEFKENTLESISRYFDDWNLDQVKVKRVFDEKNKPTNKVDYIISMSRTGKKLESPQQELSQELDNIKNLFESVDVNEKSSADTLLTISAKIIHLANKVTAFQSR
ncbi:hypothetical protein [Fructobacillus evanidus]|uniref:Uncharacterized protein n=1 Tax=Fructobacillus evanidus TaxID=3064281 RepID=A0ABM9MN18_9LACO|nr:unnamed protein product [Fructobacillus sp. LMG 32999]CAK1222110.1 unnamed protein product [Fructobacillus sp. LMG 32999]CAK1226362.1 unnamed protein product [Fructobacillus sp. LMG 32999]CAK1226571.1 unnamed protein product [Fructobacillus sp. LMG 32999]CAK1226715.1 unnamed protein product [Fructobacillus sp. LMG 32999]